MSPCPTSFLRLYGLGIKRVVDQAMVGEASNDNTRVTDLLLVGDVVILGESMEVKSLHKTAKPLRFHVSWNKTKVQVFGG